MILRYWINDFKVHPPRDEWLPNHFQQARSYGYIRLLPRGQNGGMPNTNPWKLCRGHVHCVDHSHAVCHELHLEIRQRARWRPTPAGLRYSPTIPRSPSSRRIRGMGTATARQRMPPPPRPMLSRQARSSPVRRSETGCPTLSGMMSMACCWSTRPIPPDLPQRRRSQ